MSINKDVICHAEGDRCHGCDHYYGRAPVCVFAPKQTPAPARGTETPRTDAATAGVDFFITDSDQRAYSATDYECLRDEMKKIELELSSAQEQIVALREALGLVMTKLREENESDDPMYPFSFDASWEAAAMKADAALAATRKEEGNG